MSAYLGLPCRIFPWEGATTAKYWKDKSNIVLKQLQIIVFECSSQAQVCRTCCLNMQHAGFLWWNNMKECFGEERGEKGQTRSVHTPTPETHNPQLSTIQSFWAIYAGFYNRGEEEQTVCNGMWSVCAYVLSKCTRICVGTDSVFVWQSLCSMQSIREKSTMFSWWKEAPRQANIISL